MFTKHFLEQTEPPRSPRETLPTMYDLPSENPEEPGLPDEFHDFQPELLRLTFKPANYSPEKIFCGSDMNLYYDLYHTNWYKRPDWFGVVGVSRLYEEQDLRLSYVIWQEGVSPFVVVELLSPGTEDEDLGENQTRQTQPPSKWEVYEQILRIPYYVVFSRYTNQLRAFVNTGGEYQELDLKQSRVWMPQLQIGLGLWLGEYAGINRLWLRWYDALGNWIPTEAEAANLEATAAKQEATAAKQEATAAKQEAEQQRQRAEEAEARARALAQKLKELGFSE